MISSLKKYLEEKLKEELLGKKAHEEVAPYRKIDFDDTDIANARKSGVLILFYTKKDKIYTVLIQRPVYEGKHSGQISFPGGKQEEKDKNIFETALREANEELGIVIEDVEIIGQLSNVYIPVSNFYVSPILGMINYYPPFIPDKREVSAIIELEISQLLIENNLQKQKIKTEKNIIINTPAFVFDEKVIWGATALMLNELKYLLLDWKNHITPR